MNTILETNDIKDIAHGIFDDLKKAKKSSIMPIFAFNWTGKTRLSNELVEIINKDYRIDFFEIYKELKNVQKKR